MCGFIAAFGEKKEVLDNNALRRALERMRRRGPDDEGTWQRGGVRGHRRLAILDLDSRAAQPMQSNCGRYVIAFNGEIHNFRALRRDLESRGVEFRTTSDTEVILALFAAEGEAMLPKLHGMFALAIWDCIARRAFIARDPYGIKPLYLAVASGAVLVASQVKALLALGQIESMSYLRNQLLRDSDWASMGHSLELRTSLVDAFLLQQVQRCLQSFSDWPDKILLAKAPAKPLPQSIIKRRKTGFSIPVNAWFPDVPSTRKTRPVVRLAIFVAGGSYQSSL